MTLLEFEAGLLAGYPAMGVPEHIRLTNLLQIAECVRTDISSPPSLHHAKPSTIA